jgi:hypothetical protein
MSAPGNSAWPAQRGDWTGLAAAAERLLADRAQADPASVAAGRLTAIEAENRLRTMGDLAAIWRAVASKEAIPELQVEHAATRADVMAAAKAWAKIAAAQPSQCLMAERVAALAWYHQPATTLGTPMIVLVHEFNQHHRALRASRPAKPAAAPAPASAGPKLRQQRLFA